jgi:hypothetical protein
MLVCRNGDGSRSELSLWLSAAKWTTTSERLTSSSTSAASATDPCTNSMSSRTGDRDASLPAYVSASSTVIVCSGCSRSV